MKQNSMNWWNKYWFAPAPVLDLAVVRIVVVGAQILLLLFYSSFGRLEQFAGLDDAMYHPIPVFRIVTIFFGFDFRPDLPFLLVVYWSAVLTGFMALLGIFTNISLGIFTLCNIFITGFLYSFGDFHHTQAPLYLCLVVLTLSPCGRALALDRLIFSKPSYDDVVTETHVMAGWPIKLMQWIFALIYISAFLEKMIFLGGTDWLNGVTLQYYMARDTLWRGSLMGEWMHRHHEIVLLGQYVTVIFQGTFWISLIFGWLKWIYVPLGFAFHVLIYVQLNAFFPEWMAVYIIFVPSSAFILAYRRTKIEGFDFRWLLGSDIPAGQK